MPAVSLTLVPTDLRALTAELANLRKSAPLARVTMSSHVAWIVRQALQQAQEAHAARAQALLEKYLPVPRSVAAAWFSRCKGLVPLDELRSAAYEEAAKAMRRFNPSLRNPETGEPVTPVGFLKRWAHYGCQALVKARLSEQQQELRPDQDEPGRWERLGGEHGRGELEPQDLARALDRFGTAKDRRIVSLVAQGADYDTTAARAGVSVDDVRQVLARLQAHLHAQGVEHEADEELTIAQAAARYGLSAKALSKRLRAGTLRGRKCGGEWMIFDSDVRTT